MGSSDRRGFLRGLASLPLIGGGVALIGSPTAAAAEVTDSLLDTYDRWLDLERSFLRWHRWGRRESGMPYFAEAEVVFRSRQTGEVWDVNSGCGFGFNHSRPDPTTRAAVILSAAGVPLT